MTLLALGEERTDMRTILDYLERTVEKYPDSRAVEDEKECLTWKELETLSKRIGTAAARRISPGAPVVILAEKSVTALAAMFGVVYGGGFYVNIEPGQPPKRLREIFRVLQPELVMLNPESLPLLSQGGYEGKYCLLQDGAAEEAEEKLLLSRRRDRREEDILYVSFTSGSTGTPKGIAVSHRAVTDFIGHFTELFHITKGDRMGNQAPFDFDISVKDVYSSVFTGATLVLIPRRLFSVPAALLDYLEEKKVTVLIWAVSALTLVSSLGGLDYKIPLTVRRVLFSGEVMPPGQLARWQKALPEGQFVNLYGPTEITCNCTYFPVKRSYREEERIPIGKAFPGRRVFLLDEEGQEIREPGKTGEICVAGESIALGYYNDREATARSFRRGKEDEVYYRTGDLGCFGAEGELYFAGRKDFQIKFNGHRIELEEIESALNQIPGVEGCCCVLDSRKTCLCAFYMGTVPPEKIRGILRESLPGYMIPRKIFRTEALPLNKNGKTDRSLLRQKMEERLC